MTITRLTALTLLLPNLIASWSPIHDRMPVILPSKHYDLWLDKDAPVEVLEKELKPYPTDEWKHIELV